MPPVRGWSTELSRELVEQLVIAATVGGYKRSAALACGVKPELLEFWLSEGMRDDAPELWQELSCRFQAASQNTNLALVDVITRAARLGDWQAALAMLKHRDPLWSGNEKFQERDTAPPTSSLEERRRQLVAELRDARLNPHSDLGKALAEAGLLRAPEESEAPRAALGPGKPETQTDE